MEVFDDEGGVRLSIEFFNTLSGHDKVTIVSDLNPTTFKLKQHYNQLFSLLSQVQLFISKFDDITIGNRLVEIGLDNTYARLIVSNIKKHAPTEEYQLHQVSKIPDDVFAKAVPEIIKSRLHSNTSEDELVETFNITKEQSQCITNTSRTILNSLARGDITKETLRKNTLANCHLINLNHCLIPCLCTKNSGMIH